MKKILALLLSALMLLGLLAACGTPAAEESAPPSGEESAAPASEAPVPAEPVELKVWHDGDEAIMQTIADTVNPMLADSGVSLVFEKRTGLSDQLKLYGGDAANGPDMYFYAHDSLGTFAAMDILAPLTDLVDESTWAGDLEMTVEAGQIGGVQYLLPVYFETLLFIYNKALWQGDIPATTEELYEYMAANTDTAAGTYAVVNQHSTAYNVSPFINGFGGYIIDENANPGLNDAKTIEAVEYNKKFAALQADGDYNTVTTLFNEGKAAAIIGGPWLVSGIRAAGIDFGVASLSDMTLPNGNALAPYSGVQGVGVMKVAAEAKGEAIALALEALASPEVGIASPRAAAAPRPALRPMTTPTSPRTR
ncbi:MAG: extracellular solute-binding protein [Lachnospiraceae bacterium]